MNTAIKLIDDADQTIDVTIEFTCVHDLTETVAKAATCTATGNNAYWTCSKCGKVFQADQITETTVEAETIAALGHSYGAPTWSWTGTALATAVFTCTRCNDRQTVPAAITSAVTTSPTAATAGVRTYTATVSFEGATYTTTTTARIPATGGGGRRPTVEIEDPDVPLTGKPFPFVDVPETKWFYDGVKKAYDMELMSGVSDTLFDPQGNTTRGMVAMILYRMEGMPSVASYHVTISDLKDTSWYHDAAIWAYATGAYKGYEDGTFRGDELVTREQLATVKPPSLPHIKQNLI